jgi:formylglycine-generating enzyme required for sulfatase activity
MILKKCHVMLAAAVSVTVLGVPAGAADNLPPAKEKSSSKPTAVDTKDMALIPAGNFTMGSDKEDASQQGKEFGNTKPWYLDEHPQHKATVKAFYLDKFEVTNEQYRTFVQKTGHAPPDPWIGSGYIVSLKKDKLQKLTVEQLRNAATKIFRLDIDTRAMQAPELLAAIDQRLTAMGKLPVTEVNWYDAAAYCRGNGKRLPTETEWEKAARGETGQEFPWGNEWSPNMSNTGNQSWDDGVAPVGSYQNDKSPYGIFDMAGNVSEWVDDWYMAYDGATYVSEDFGKKYKVVRGAGWGGEGHYAISLFQRSAYRYYREPDATYNDIGFRCAIDAR